MNDAPWEGMFMSVNMSQASHWPVEAQALLQVYTPLKSSIVYFNIMLSQFSFFSNET